MTETLRAAIYGGLVGALSPVLFGIGIGVYRGMTLYYLRYRQREAIWRICKAIKTLDKLGDVPEIDFAVLKIVTLFDFYERSLFGPRCPSGMVIEWTEMQAILLELKRLATLPWSSIDNWNARLRPFLLKVDELHSKARLVLFTL